MTTRLASLPQSEADFQRTVVAYARLNQWRCGHIADSRKQVRKGGRLILVGDPDAAGLPDWVFCRERVVWAELKGPRTVVKDEQVAWMTALIGAGEEVHLWRAHDPARRSSVDPWPEIERVLGGRVS